MSLPHPASDGERFLFEWVRPRANDLDQSKEALAGALREMAARGFLGLRVPAQQGGAGIEDREFRRFQETCARCSGVLAFLQTQHQSACGFLAKGDNAQLQANTLPRLATGEWTAGIAFSQLRRSGSPMLTAEQANNGYQVTGRAPWVTGWGIFSHCVSAATLPSGESLFFWHELTESAHLQPSPVMRLAAMETAQTVSCRFNGLLVPSSDVLYIRPADWIQENDMLNLALQSPFALGCAQAGVDLLHEALEKKPLDAIREAAARLQSRLDTCRERAYSAMESRDSNESLAARASAIELAVRCAHAAVVAHSGAANSLQHAAQRVYREALVFSVSAQTTAILEATLDRLSR